VRRAGEQRETDTHQLPAQAELRSFPRLESCSCDVGPLPIPKPAIFFVAPTPARCTLQGAGDAPPHAAIADGECTTC